MLGDPLQRSNPMTSPWHLSERTPLLPHSAGAVAPVPHPPKLSTFSGVFIPTSLNVLSILMFLRFGFIIGQMGVGGTLGLLVASYAINLLTTLSISAIATNGTVRGGGAYYMLSRSLGAEFGGSIGVVFYVGQVLNAALNVVGLLEPIMANFNAETGLIAPVLREGAGHMLVYTSVLLALCTAVSLTGASHVSRAGTGLCAILLLATLSVPLSTLVVRPFTVPGLGLDYTGPAWSTLRANLYPHFTPNAAGSAKPPGVAETVQTLFGVFFPATAGIFAGASMSGDLRLPSRSIPRGTLWGLLLTFTCYAMVIVSLGASVPRALLHRDVNVLQTVNASRVVVLLGELATSLFSVIMGLVGGSNVLCAMAEDALFPGLSFFSGRPRACILVTWLIAQVCLLADVNQLATFITMAFLMTFIVTNLACFLLKVAAAPNFRPSFRYFSAATAGTGGLAAVAAMFVVDGVSAVLVMVFLSFLFLFIHYTCPPKVWGDVSQSLIYHQVRKYLLRLRQDNVKYWRPQILLLVDDPHTAVPLIQFCNHLKKGGLYILGHVLVAERFQESFRVLVAQKTAWTTLRDTLGIKAFVHVGLGLSLPWGIRNVYLGSGLGGMRPNIIVLGFLDVARAVRGRRVGRGSDLLPEATPRITLAQWVQSVEDLILMGANVAVAHGFRDLPLPPPPGFIDLYPIQMSAVATLDNGRSVLSTNFDTCTLILQLGAILHTVPEWRRTHTLRIIVFVEWADEVADERVRLASLLESLRITAAVKVLCLQELPAYRAIVKGEGSMDRYEPVLAEEEWWANLKRARRYVAQPLPSMDLPVLALTARAVGKFVAIKKRRYTMATLQDRGAMSFSLSARAPAVELALGAVLVCSEALGGCSEHLSTAPLAPSPSSPPTGDASLGSATFGRDDSAMGDPRGSSQSGSSRAHRASVGEWRPAVPKARGLLQPPEGVESASQRPALSRTPSGATTPRLKPNFSSVKLPQAAVNEASEGSQQSIYFVEEETRTRGEPSRLRGLRVPSHLFEPADPEDGRKDLEEELASLSFNDIPAKGQHLILNHLMKHVSLEAAVIFSTLPPPVLGTYLDDAAATEYVENIDVWCNGVPPMMLVNAQTVTVTTAL